MPLTVASVAHAVKALDWMASAGFVLSWFDTRSVDFFFPVYFPLFQKSKHLYIKKSVVKVVKSHRLISRGVQIHLRRNRSTVTRNGETAENFTNY